MPIRPLVLLARLALLVLLASCGGSSTGSGGDPSTGDELDDLGEMEDEPVVEHRGGAVESLGITPPDRPWAEMSHDEREMYMVGKVLPVMSELFRERFPERYPNGVTCETCHGPDGAAQGFHMPSGHLMPLPAPGSPAATALASNLPESIAFMRETVTPAMGTLIGAEHYRCSGCHTSAP